MALSVCESVDFSLQIVILKYELKLTKSITTVMKPLTVDILVQCGASRTHAAIYVDTLNELLPLYFINTHLRLSHWLAQCLHESNGFRAVEEYASGADYEGRRSLGNTQPGDGPRYRGRGLVQLTGRSNYTAFAKKYGIDCVNHPELLEQPRWAVVTALYYWNSRLLNAKADKDDIKGITKSINGGLNGYPSRVELLAKCKVALLPLF